MYKEFNWEKWKNFPVLFILGTTRKGWIFSFAITQYFWFNIGMDNCGKVLLYLANNAERFCERVVLRTKVGRFANGHTESCKHTVEEIFK